MIDEELLDRLRPYIEAALAYNANTQTFDQVAESLMSGEYQLWLGEQSLAITEVCELPNKTLTNIVLGAGNLTELRATAQRIAEQAKDRGHGGVMIVGRRGWGRVLDGFVETATVYVKEI